MKYEIKPVNNMYIFLLYHKGFSNFKHYLFYFDNILT